MANYIRYLVIIAVSAEIHSSGAMSFVKNNTCHQKYGDIMKLSPIEASWANARANHLSYTGEQKDTGSSNSCYLKYGDIMKLSPTGASWATATANHLGYNGVPASQTLAKRDLSAIKSLWVKIKKTADDLCIEPALIAAMASRESNAGSVWKTSKCKGWGDCHPSGSCTGCLAWGYLQCDIHSSGIGKQCCELPWDSQQLMELTLREVLIAVIKKIQVKFPGWKQEQDLQGAVAAYNCGAPKVISWPKVDEGTYHKDYSNDVLARAQWLKKQIDI